MLSVHVNPPPLRPHFRQDTSDDEDAAASPSAATRRRGRTTRRLRSLLTLMGPSGSGKTAAIHAIADTLGFRILELNTSMLRSGKEVCQHHHCPLITCSLQLAACVCVCVCLHCVCHQQHIYTLQRAVVPALQVTRILQEATQSHRVSRGARLL